tara:strand:- start:877 stop:1419 length:543 start_codon:yes stop_codon:yes gene_type:complete
MSLLLLASVSIAACQQQPSAGETEVADVQPEHSDAVFESPGKTNLTPLNVSYRLLDVPQVGQPFRLELTLISSQATSNMGYSVAAEGALVVAPHEAERTFSSKPASVPETSILTITPAMEGRFYVQVTASAVFDGRRQPHTVTIPIQVGQGTRQLEQMGEVVTDEDGNPVVSLPAEIDQD